MNRNKLEIRILEEISVTEKVMNAGKKVAANYCFRKHIEFCEELLDIITDNKAALAASGEEIKKV